ncbi:hypothetical protein K1T71_009992 [Dendrolimus kikuchii]|uniref:Uncharacterized protein n=1 Tax=Dendrolimus kikuchii TaxID=765133 RepID=A0ACC1CT63_9NEOP|nr:hypothetical protein K1T71_009992 [Dendrolimus kikuchii]
MVVCKFFQQGNCRYGQNCAYEHVYGSKYNYYANAPSQPNKPQQTGVTDEQLVNQVQSDVQAVLRGGQWILSSYAPFKEMPSFPGIINLSPEEARLLIYDATSNNNLDQVISYINKVVKENRSKYEQLLQPNANIINTLRSIYKGETPAEPFTSTVNAGLISNPSSLFRSAAQNTPVFNQSATPSIFSQNTNAFSSSSVFAQNKSIFGPQNNQSVVNQGQGIFAQSQETAAKSIFAQASQNIFGPQTSTSNQNQNLFNTQSPSSIFASANQNIFGPKETQNAFLSQTQNTNVFQKSDSSTVSPNVFQQAVVADSGVYSKMEDLQEEDLEMYRSEEFTLGFVPEMPPPHSLCF